MVTEAERKASVQRMVELKAFIAELEAMPQPDSIPPELLAQLKKERKLLKPFLYVAPDAGCEHYLARWLAYAAYQKINELVRVYDKAAEPAPGFYAPMANCRSRKGERY